MTDRKPLDTQGRRVVIRGLGGLGVMALFDCGGTGTTRAGSHVDTGSDAAGSDAANDGSMVEVDAVAQRADVEACVLEPTLTKGPYWVDEHLDRSDIRADTNGVATPNPRPGLSLTLRITVLAHGPEGCAPLTGAQVDVWHCDASGLYSDTASLGTMGQNFLRGFQQTDTRGLATFTTIYPGWYSGRCVHIHVKVRLFDATSNVTTEATTQLFFDDAITNQVCMTAVPYDTRGVPDTSNAMDGFYANNTELLLSLRGDAVSGYEGSITLGVAVGTIAQG